MNQPSSPSSSPLPPPPEWAKHYQRPGNKLQPWDLQLEMESSGSVFVDARRCDAMRYLFRVKDNLKEDLAKAAHCLQAAVEELERLAHPMVEVDMGKEPDVEAQLSVMLNKSKENLDRIKAEDAERVSIPPPPPVPQGALVPDKLEWANVRDAGATTPILFLDDRNKVIGIADVPRNHPYGWEPRDGEWRDRRWIHGHPMDVDNHRRDADKVMIRYGTESNPVRRYVIFRPKGTGFGGCVARVPWHWEHYHVPGICSKYHNAIIVDRMDYDSAIRNGGYEEREAEGPLPSAWVATVHCDVCEWRGKPIECEQTPDGTQCCPFCFRKHKRMRPVWPIESEPLTDEDAADESDGDGPVTNGEEGTDNG